MATPRFELDINKVGFRWQRRFYVFAIADLHDPRVITWVVDVAGDKGKTLFIKWFILYMKDEAVLMDITNYKDMFACRTIFLLCFFGICVSKKHIIARGSQVPGGATEGPGPRTFTTNKQKPSFVGGNTFAFKRIQPTFGRGRNT